MNGNTIYYWDACVFLSLINNHPGRSNTIEAILELAEKKEAQIFTSTLTIAEVAFARIEKDRKALDKTVEEKIDKLWHPTSPVDLIEVHQLVMIEARNLIRLAIQSGMQLKPADAIHLATAKRMNVEEFHTYDDLSKHKSLVNFQIIEPYLKPRQS